MSGYQNSTRGAAANNIDEINTCEIVRGGLQPQCGLTPVCLSATRRGAKIYSDVCLRRNLPTIQNCTRAPAPDGQESTLQPPVAAPRESVKVREAARRAAMHLSNDY